MRDKTWPSRIPPLEPNVAERVVSLTDRPPTGPLFITLHRVGYLLLRKATLLHGMPLQYRGSNCRKTLIQAGVRNPGDIKRSNNLSGGLVD